MRWHAVDRVGKPVERIHRVADREALIEVLAVMVEAEAITVSRRWAVPLVELAAEQDREAEAERHRRRRRDRDCSDDLERWVLDLADVLERSPSSAT